MLRVVADDDARAELSVDLDEICREGARRMLAAALGAERDAYLAASADERDPEGRRLVVGNGRARSRMVATGAGPIEVEAPRINDKRVDETTGQRRRFRSQILAPWCRKSPKVSEVLPLMYLHGMSSGDFAAALGEFFGSDAGLSPSVITRLTKSWQEERERFAGAQPGRRGLCVLLGGRGALQCAFGERPAVLSGDGGCASRWHQGVGGYRRRLSGVHRLVGGPAARLQAPGDTSPGGDGGRRGAGPVGGAARGVPRDPHPALLGAQSRQRGGRPAQVGARLGSPGVGRDPRRRGPGPRRDSHPGVRGRLRGQVAQGGGQDRRRRRGPAHLLRLPGRALDPFEDHQPDRVHLRHRAPADQGDQRRRAPKRLAWPWPTS